MPNKEEYTNERRDVKKMKAIVLGLPRTGTTCLNTYNYYEIFRNKEKGHFESWISAIDAKYNGVGKPFEPEDFDHILEEYNVVAASPCWMFVDELLAAYPDAKVILSIRPPEAWLASLKETVSMVLSRKIWGVISLADQYTALHWRLLTRIYFTLSQGEPP
ncbi:hypothetical protein V2A60_002096 [Cordyceps javanica]